MNRFAFFCMLIFFAVISSSLFLHGMPIPKKKPVPNVEGQTWISEDQKEVKLGVIQYTFLKDGKFEYMYSNGKVYTKGSWKQKGEDLYWECNDKVAEFNLKFIDGKFVGKAKNVADMEWNIIISPKRKEVEKE